MGLNILLTADRNNVEDVMQLASERDLGVEVMAFAYPDILDGNWKNTVATYRTILRRIIGPVTLHGPFLDMAAGSPDTRINQVVFQRFQHAIHIASELEVKTIVLHANYIGSLHNEVYREGWHKRNVAFWFPLAEIARENGVTIALENMWEYEPSILADLLREVNHSNLQACIDIGHAYVFGDKDYDIQHWLDMMEPWLIHIHSNNNNGIIDEHYGYDWQQGVLDYNRILRLLHAMNKNLNVVLEMYHVEDMRDSLYYFEEFQDNTDSEPDKIDRTMAS